MRRKSIIIVSILVVIVVIVIGIGLDIARACPVVGEVMLKPAVAAGVGLVDGAAELAEVKDVDTVVPNAEVPFSGVTGVVGCTAVPGTVSVVRPRSGVQATVFETVPEYV